MSVTSKENWVWSAPKERPRQIGNEPARRWAIPLLIALLLATAHGPRAAHAQSPLRDPARLLILDPAALHRAKQSLGGGDAILAPAAARLRREADRALDAKIDPVTNKAVAPPRGDKRDYMSIAPYWWPNPNTDSGLPYLRRDGEVNPERDRISDRQRLGAMIQTVKTLAAAYFFTGGESYAERAALHLRAWFLAESSRMSPHLRYAQAIPGRNHGRAAGIIETHNFPDLLDAVGLLAAAPTWSKSDHARLQSWFGNYLDWLMQSSEGKIEATALNNHGTWYDVQVAACALFIGHDPLAKRVLGDFAGRRIAKQIEIDGRQPRELARTQAWHYSIFNLEGLLAGASLADKIGIDLWHFESTDKRSIRAAVDWLMPFATGAKSWSHPQITSFQPEKLAPALRRAGHSYRKPEYESTLGKISKITGDERWQLLYANLPAARY